MGKDSLAPVDEDTISPEKLNAKAPVPISDVFTGLNQRKSDRNFQAIFILASIVAACFITVIWKGFDDIGPKLVLALLAGLAGGTFISGGILAVYRLFIH